MGTVQNADTTFQLDSDPAISDAEATLNADIQRLLLDPQSRHPNGLGGIPTISGNISIPVISMHTIADYFVPFSMEQAYARRVAANGDSDLLVSRESAMSCTAASPWPSRNTRSQTWSTGWRTV